MRSLDTPLNAFSLCSPTLRERRVDAVSVSVSLCRQGTGVKGFVWGRGAHWAQWAQNQTNFWAQNQLRVYFNSGLISRISKLNFKMEFQLIEKDFF